MADVSKIKLPNNSEVNIKDSRIPAVTATDNGKILKVVSGAWSKANAGYLSTSGGSMGTDALINLSKSDPGSQDTVSMTISGASIQIDNDVDNYFTYIDGELPGLTVKTDVGVSTEKTTSFMPNGIYHKASQSANSVLLEFPNKSGTIALTSDIPVELINNILCGTSTTIRAIEASDGTYAVGQNNSDGTEDYILATTNQLPTESTVSGWGFTKNTGTLTGVKFNNVSATVSNGIASITATIPSAPGTLKTNNTTAQTASASESLSGTINLHKVAKTGTYSDLIGTPTIPTVDSEPTSGSTNAVSSGGVYTAMSEYLPLSGGTMTGPLVLTPTADSTVTSEGIDFGTAAHMASSNANSSPLFSIYSKGPLSFRPGTGSAYSSNYGLYINSSEVQICAETNGTPTLRLRRGTTSDAYVDLLIKNSSGKLSFARSVNGNDTALSDFDTSGFYPQGTITNNISSLSLGLSTNQWASVYAKDATFSGNVAATGTVTGSNIPTYYSGTSDPSGSLGSNGDIYLKLSS